MQNGSYIPHFSRRGYVAWVGMIRQPKRPDRLLEIAQRLPEVRFVVCGGSTPHRNPEGYSERLIEEMRRLPNLEFLGLVPPDKSLEIIARADVLLSTSDGEGFPSVFLEAWSSGTPVVSLEIDPDHIIARQKLGKVSGTVEKAAMDLKSILNSVEERERIAARARRYIADHHSNSAVVSVFERNLPTL
jgi:glycosyltransferase involved in cell wall biosynthesis